MTSENTKKQPISCNDSYGIFDIRTLDFSEMKIWMMLLHKFSGDGNRLSNITIKEIKDFTKIKRNDRDFVFGKLKSTVEKVNSHIESVSGNGVFFTDLEIDGRFASVTMNEKFKDVFTNNKKEKSGKLVYFNNNAFVENNSVTQQRFFIGMISKRGFGFWRVKESDLIGILDMDEKAPLKKRNQKIKNVMKSVGDIISKHDGTKTGWVIEKERKKNTMGDYYYDFKWVNKKEE